MPRASIATVALALLVASCPALVFAQEKTKEEPGKVQAIKAVEHGLFVETDIGVGMLVNKLNDRSYGLSIMTGVFLGYDLLPILSLSVGGVAMVAPVSRDRMLAGAQGDLLFIMPMLNLQFALITTERNFLWIRGGAGFGLALPETLGDANNDHVEDDYGGNGPVFQGTVGFERFTKLRHFSLGIEAGILGVTKPAFGLAIIVSPTIKYTF